MGIDVVCACGKMYAVTDDKAGKYIRCRQCQSITRVPWPGADMDVISSDEAVALPMAVVPPADAPWLYTRAGRVAGRVSEKELRALILAGKVSVMELAWREGSPTSQRIGDIPTFSPLVPCHSIQGTPQRPPQPSSNANNAVASKKRETESGSGMRIMESLCIRVFGIVPLLLGLGGICLGSPAALFFGAVFIYTGLGLIINGRVPEPFRTFFGV